MSDLISRVKLLEKLPYIKDDDSNNKAIWTICHEPEVDAVEVVRCKDCKHWCVDEDNMWCSRKDWLMKPDDFCSDGRRKDDAK